MRVSRCRISEIFLKNWLVKQKSKPLILRGARQTGKSTLVRNVMEASDFDLCEINCELYPKLDNVFATLNVQKIIDEIESLPGKKKISAKTVLFLDEIQSTPHALAALRYFYENRPDLKVICAGSLLDFALTDHTFSMPVGRVEFHHIVPMNFEEFLIACGEQKLCDVLNQFTLEDPMSEQQHDRFIELQQKYFFIGGMPEAVREYNEHNKLSVARDVHESILEAYKLDFAKYGLKLDLPRLAQILDQCALQITHPIKLSKLLPDEQSKTIRRLLNLLIQARLISQVIHTDANDVPLGAEEDRDLFKLLMVDVGLLNAITGQSWTQLKDSQSTMSVKDGAVAEQFVGQEFISTMRRGEQKLNFWLRNGKSTNAEVDYLASFDNDIVPIQVKAGKSGRLRSLKNFCENRNPSVAFRFDTQRPTLDRIKFQPKTNSTRDSCPIISLPLYTASQIERLYRDFKDRDEEI